MFSPRSFPGLWDLQMVFARFPALPYFREILQLSSPAQMFRVLLSKSERNRSSGLF